LTASTIARIILAHAPIAETGPMGPVERAVFIQASPAQLIIAPKVPIQNNCMLKVCYDQYVIATIITNTFTTRKHEKDTLVPLKLIPFSLLVIVLMHMPFAQNVSGVIRPIITGIHIGSIWPSLIIFGASLTVVYF